MSIPPSQSLYDIVKPSDEPNTDDGEKQHASSEPAEFDNYPQGHEWGDKDIDGENWVTVFGFPPSQIPYILLHFQSYGDIVRHYVPPGQCNWVNIQYQTRLQAKKALSKNGKIIGDNHNLMVGVVECSDKAWLQTGDISNKSYGGGIGFPRPLHPPSQRQLPRSYKVDIFDSQRPPVAHNSMWGKFVEYIIGS